MLLQTPSMFENLFAVKLKGISPDAGVAPGETGCLDCMLHHMTSEAGHQRAWPGLKALPKRASCRALFLEAPPAGPLCSCLQHERNLVTSPTLSDSVPSTMAPFTGLPDSPSLLSTADGTCQGHHASACSIDRTESTRMVPKQHSPRGRHLLTHLWNPIQTRLHGGIEQQSQ